MDNVNKLTEIFSHFPGIGPRQAKRFVYHLLNQGDFANKQLADLILELKKETGSCHTCKRFHKSRDCHICTICQDEKRDHKALMIVAKDVDLENIEKSGSFRGLYFVLGGLIPVLEKNPETKIHQTELLETLKKMPELKEIILALSATTEGDYTADYLKRVLAPLLTERGVTISMLGRGLSTGTELEYSDSDTIKNALKNRE